MTGARLVELYARHPAVSDGFASWLDSADVSLIFVAGGDAWTVGRAADGRVCVADISLTQPISAIAGSGDGVAVAGWQVWRYANGLAPGTTTPEGYDRLLLPQSGVTVGAIGVTDLAETPEGIVFSSGRLGCLGSLHSKWSFHVEWLPPWVSAVADDDRCPIGGFTRDDLGRMWVAVYGRTDQPGEWRAARAGGGSIVSTNGIDLCEGLTMPAAPRLSGSDLVIPDSGSGRLLRADTGSGLIEVVRGWVGACSAVAVHGRTAVVGVSSPLGAQYDDLPAFDGAPVQDHDSIVLVDLDSGVERGRLDLAGRGIGIESMLVLAGSRWPVLAPPRGPDARRMVSIGAPDHV
jgi:uncharacterized protein (TIGR03032 family)